MLAGAYIIIMLFIGCNMSCNGKWNGLHMLLFRPLDVDGCTVCKDAFKVGDTLRKLPCKHLFHETCIIPWLKLVSCSKQERMACIAAPNITLSLWDGQSALDIDLSVACSWHLTSYPGSLGEGSLGMRVFVYYLLLPLCSMTPVQHVVIMSTLKRRQIKKKTPEGVSHIDFVVV